MVTSAALTLLVVMVLWISCMLPDATAFVLKPIKTLQTTHHINGVYSIYSHSIINARDSKLFSSSPKRKRRSTRQNTKTGNESGYNLEKEREMVNAARMNMEEKKKVTRNWLEEYLEPGKPGAEPKSVQLIKTVTWICVLGLVLVEIFVSIKTGGMPFSTEKAAVVP